MSEIARRASNRQRVLEHLKLWRSATNEELRAIGGARAMGRVNELQQEHEIAVVHLRGGLWRVDYRGPRVSGQGRLAL